MENRHHIRGMLLLLLLIALVGACAPPSTTTTAYPVTPSYYYVVPTTTYLRSCASYSDECYVVAQVFSGDRGHFPGPWDADRLTRQALVPA